MAPFSVLQRTLVPVGGDRAERSYLLKPVAFQQARSQGNEPQRIFWGSSHKEDLMHQGTSGQFTQQSSLLQVHEKKKLISECMWAKLLSFSE